MDPFSLQVTAGAEPHLAQLVLQIESDPSSFVPVDTLSLMIGHPAIILVDDDGGASLEEYYLSVLEDTLDMFIEYWDVAEQGGPGDDWLSNSDVAIWFTGSDTTGTLESFNRSQLGQFLDAGGGLILSGAGIGRDIGSESFYGDYLHAGYAGTTGEYIVRGVPGHPVVGDSMLVLLAVATRDIITPVGGADSMLYYDSGGGAGITYAGGYHVAYFPFGLESIEESAPVGARRYELLGRTLNWMGITGVGDSGTGGEVMLEQQVPLLFQNRPNPFSHRTDIRYIVPGAASGRARVDLAVYNILGQRVRTLVAEEQAAGEYTVRWDGRDSAGARSSSGVYFYRLEVEGSSDVRRMVCLQGRGEI
jgi:hypothetical protein